MSLNDIITNDDSLLDAIYWYEQNDGEIYTKKLSEIIKKLHREREKEYENIINTLNNEKIKDKLVGFIENYAETFREEQSCKDEHYFKYGFKDAIKLILQSYNYN